MKNSEKILTLAVVLSLAALLNVAPALAREAESGGGASGGSSSSGGSTGGGGFDSARDILERGAGATPTGTPHASGFDSARDLLERGPGATPGFDDRSRNSGLDSARDILERGGTFNANLGVGHRSGDVRRLQQRLRDEGVFNGPVTGFFGEMTKKAVVEFQRKHGLAESGIVGKSTRDELNRGRGSIDDSLSSRGRGNGADDATEVQGLIAKILELLGVRR